MLKSEEVSALIKICSESGVSQLKWGNLRVNFGSPKKPSYTLEIPDTEISEQTTQLSHSNLVKEELQTREDELDHMLVEDPLAYEEMILAGELESKDSGNLDGGREKES